MDKGFDALIAEAAEVDVTGWDFSWLDGRATEERPPWGYQKLMGERVGRATMSLHCGNPGVRVTDPTGEYIGTAGAKHGDHDIMLIPTGNVVNQQYVGGGDSNSTEVVRGWGDVYTGEYLCQSGVTSARVTGAPVCDIKVLFFYADREDLVEGEQVNGRPAARAGDTSRTSPSRSTATASKRCTS